MKRSNFIVFICILIALVSTSGLFNNFGYPARSLITTLSAGILFTFGGITIYAMWTKKLWASNAMLIWMSYGVINNFVFFFKYRTGSILYPAIAVVVAAVFIKPVISRIKKDSETVGKQVSFEKLEQ